MTDEVQNTKLCNLAIRMGEAEKNRDAEFFENLLSDKLTFRRVTGVVVDKATYLEGLRNPANTYEMLESEEVAATTYEGVAVVTLLVRAKGMRGAIPLAGVYRNIRIFVCEPQKEKQPWQLYAWFNVTVPDMQP